MTNRFAAPAALAMLSGALFVTYSVRQPSGQETILVTNEMQARFVENRSTMLGRELTDEERTAAIDILVEDEVLVREAYRAGMDLGDLRVRQRLISSGRAAVRDTSAERPPEPTAGEVLEFFEGDPDRYRIPERRFLDFVSFLYGTLTPEEEEVVRSQLQRGMAPASVGNGLGEYLTAQTMSRRDISRVMGRTFADEVFDLEPGSWHGPLRSPQAIFFMRIRNRMAAEARPFADIEAMVREELIAERARAAQQGAVDEAGSHYRISVEDDAE